MYRFHRKERIDIINAHWLYPDSIAAYFIAKILGIPLVITALGSDVHRDISRKYFGNIILWVLKRVQKVTTKSNSLKEILTKKGVSQEKIEVIQNGIDIDKFDVLDKFKCKQDLNLQLYYKYIVFIGRLETVKNPQILIEAVELISKMKFDQKIKVIMIGNGSLEEDIKNQIKDSKLTDFFILKNKVSHSEIPKWINSADLLCLSSLNEGHPNVIMEALACGCPVVSSNVGDVSEYINKSNGIIFKKKSKSDLAQALIAGMANKWNRQTIRNSVIDMTWEKSAEKYLTLFDSSLENGGQ